MHDDEIEWRCCMWGSGVDPLGLWGELGEATNWAEVAGQNLL